LQAALVQINEGLYFRNPRLATRFESNAANIAKVLVNALLNLITKIQYPRKSGGKKQSTLYFLLFFFKNSSSKYQKRFAIGGYTAMFFCSQLFGFFPFRLCRRQPEIAKFIRNLCFVGNPLVETHFSSDSYYPCVTNV